MKLDIMLILLHILKVESSAYPWYMPQPKKISTNGREQ